MTEVSIYGIAFNDDDKCFEKVIKRGVRIKEYDEYTGTVTLKDSNETFKLDTVKITDNAGYLVTMSNLSLSDVMPKILSSLKRNSISIINSESVKLDYLEQFEM